MILIEVNNQDTKNNFQLIEETEEWAKKNIEGEYTILLNPNLGMSMRITGGKIETEGSTEKI